MTLIAGNIIDYFIQEIHSLEKKINIRSWVLGAGCWFLAAFAMSEQQSTAQTVNFQLVKSEVYPSPTAPGNLVSYTITYINTSSNIATNVIITDNLPPANLFTYASSSNTGVYNSVFPSVVWNLGTVPANGSGFVTVSGYWGSLGASYVPPYNLTSYYTSYGSSTNTITNGASILCDQSPLGISATNVSAVVPQTCGSTFPGGNYQIKQGEDKLVYYPMTIVNTGNIYDNFALYVLPLVSSRDNSSDLLLRIVDVNMNSINQSGWIPPGGSFSFLLELNGTSTTRKPTDGDIFDIIVTATSAVCGTTTSIATVTTTTYNGNPSGRQDISVTKSASVGSYTVGTGSITYTIIMSNIGQSNATGVSLRDYLPVNAPLPLPGGINPPGTISGNRVTWPTIDIAAGVTLPPYTITIYPNCLSVPALINTAEAIVAGDINQSNNTSTNTIYVTSIRPTPVLSTITPVICFNSNAELTASGASVSEIYRWYSTATGGTILALGNTYTTGIITANQTFYASIYNPISLCESDRSSITIVVNPLPQGSLSGNTICSDGTGQFTFTSSAGTGPFTLVISGITYNGVVSSMHFNATPNPFATTSYTLTSITDASTCVRTTGITGPTATITVNPLPTATISGNISVCQNAPAPYITFTGANGTPPYTFTYNINGSAPATVTTTTGNSVTVTAPTGTPGTFVYALVSVHDASSTACSNTAIGTATITVIALPTTSAIYHQ